MNNGHDKVCDQGMFNNIIKFKYKNPGQKLMDIKKLVDPISIKTLESKIWNLRVAEKQKLSSESFDFNKNKNMNKFNTNNQSNKLPSWFPQVPEIL